MTKRQTMAWFIGLIILAFSGCSSSSSSNDATAGGGSDAPPMPQLIIGSGFAFATPSLTVAAGATIMIKNEDSAPHTVTSESAPNAFVPSGVFDTGTIAAAGTATITIPASATAGTVYYYYCSIHTSLMVPANGMITVQ